MNNQFTLSIPPNLNAGGMQNLPRTFGQAVYRLRQQKEWTQEVLSEKADISRRFLLFIEAGQKSPSLETVCKLKKALGCSWDELMKGL